MGQTPGKATYDVGYPTGNANFTATNFRNNFQGLYEGDLLPLRPLAHATPNLRIMVLGTDAAGYHKNVYYGNNQQRLGLTSGDTPSMSAPVGNPRYDLVYIDPSGDIAIVTGTVAATPRIPDPPSGDVIPICSIYHKTTTTKIVNYADKDTYTGDSYIANDLRPLYTLPTVQGSTGSLDASVTVGTGLAEDTQIVFNGNAQKYHMGLDDSDDVFKVGLGQVLGTTTYISIDSTGAVKLPLQPGCRITMSASQLNLPQATFTKIQFNTEVYDTNNDFNTTTYAFTAPVIGNYLVSFKLDIREYTVNKFHAAGIYINGIKIDEFGFSYGHSTNIGVAQGTGIYNLAAADYVEIFYDPETEAGATVDVGNSFATLEIALLN